MKKLLILIFLASISVAINAQRRNVDSLKQLLLLEKTDTGRILLYYGITSHYNYADADSAVVYAKYTLQAAKAFKVQLLEADLYAGLSYSYYLSGNFVASMQAALNGLAIAEGSSSSGAMPERFKKRFFWMEDSVQNIREFVIGRNQYMIGFVYMATEEPQKAAEQFLICEKIFRAINARHYLYWSLSRLTDALGQAGNYKEALRYGLETHLLGDQLKVSQTFTKSYIGNSYWGLRDTAAAKEWYQKSLGSGRTDLDDRGLANAGLAQIFLLSNAPDSALWHAHRALYLAQTQKLKRWELSADTLLAYVHATLGNKDSAYYYLQTSLQLRNELLNSQTVQELLTVVNAEKQHKAEIEAAKENYKKSLQLYITLGAAILLLMGALLLWRNNRQKVKAHKTLTQQKEELEQTLQKLNAAQSQLIQAEKMASLGELTAGIAHEIQNPLNFVNNFSELNKELLQELDQEIKGGNVEGAMSITKDVIENEERINFHGKRADSIVKSMLQHSQKSSGQKELTDINALCDEYIRLAYHGFVAKDKSCRAGFKTHLDPSLPQINTARQDLSRAILNLINNAFYAVHEKSQRNLEGYEPGLIISTRRATDGDNEGRKEGVKISIKDNGSGIPKAVREKIFQPFFTTKPTGEGTGLGLSLTYDIIKTHGGEISVKSEEGEGSEFTVFLPA